MNKSVESLAAYLGGEGIKYEKNVSFKTLTSFKTGGNAGLTVSPKTVDELQKCVGFMNAGACPYLVLGKGSNVLAPDEGYDGAVLLTAEMNEIRLVDETTIECLAGTPLMSLCMFALDKGLTGLEFAYGIPGSVGGAVYMNGGAYGGEMKDVLIKTEHVLPDGSLGCFEGDEMQLSYRHSAYTDSNFVIARATMKLALGNKTEIEAKMQELMGRRKDKQPLEFPSAGSTFKRPEGHFAGALIEQSNLKGTGVGGAQVSEKHAGFIINRGNATSADVLSLIEVCRETVLRDSGIMLEPEVRIIENIK